MFATAELQVLQSVAVQLMNGEVVALEDQKLRGEAGGEWAVADGAVQIEWADV